MKKQKEPITAKSISISELDLIRQKIDEFCEFGREGARVDKKSICIEILDNGNILVSAEFIYFDCAKLEV